MCFPKEDKLDTENIRPLEVLGIMEYLTSGITTSFDMCYFPPVYAQVAAQCGFRAVQVSGVTVLAEVQQLLRKLSRSTMRPAT